jgi:DNA-binding MarR family transcriptional regulator
MYCVNKAINTKFDECISISQSRCELLSVIYQEEEVSQSDLQKKVTIDRAAVTRHVKQLEEDGMLIRRRKSGDDRIILVRLTNYGREQIESVQKEKERFVNELLTNVSEEERSVLKNVLSQLQKNIANIKACSSTSRHDS